MTITNVRVEGFRLLKDTHLSIEKNTTVIVGRNNSGKTSLTSIFERFLKDQGKSVRLEDFSSENQRGFFDAKKALEQKIEIEEVFNLLPRITLTCTLEYDPKALDIGPLSPFVIDVDERSHEAIVRIVYKPKLDSISKLLTPLETNVKVNPTAHFVKHLKENINSCYDLSVLAVDPTDNTNTRAFFGSVELSPLIKCNVIRAQRTLEHAKDGETNVIGKLLNSMFETASSPNAVNSDQTLASQLRTSVEGVEHDIQKSFDKMLQQLMPAMGLLGFPGMDGTVIQPQTLLNVESLLSDHTKICYKGEGSVNLPEGYNGLGTRHLIYMLLHLESYHKEYRSLEVRPSTHVIFVEEPEAHLHPQMQEVFINQLQKIVKKLSEAYPEEPEWNVQFIITTHSSHIANTADFDAIRYFLKYTDLSNPYTVIKDLKKGLKEVSQDDKEFLHKYMTLTKCDLYFADKAILVEGTTERILMPKLIQLVEEEIEEDNKLCSQYVSTIEVGGAYAHLFYPLLDFLEVKSLIITDLDSVKEVKRNKKTVGVKCPVAEGTLTSNASIKNWFEEQRRPPLETIINKTDAEKTLKNRRIAYQIPEKNNNTACARSFEDALILANMKLFKMRKSGNYANRAWLEAKKLAKSDTAFRFAILEQHWNVPRYISEGLTWLSKPKHTAKATTSEAEVNCL
ncbi:ATP-dependent nuclease [Vibrio genomosp. F10]|uniref:ATP-dependent nuclease n=1 Tax=Vibrio genomosp. F10 TaxID=723171 RepID=UPI00031739B4|nr:ATP-dependent endonuclease [Vibrio genomosp. F10]OEF06712.1 ATP-dependent endonuclease [Vibrio genomosp. F10 str. 9ZB36]